MCACIADRGTTRQPFKDRDLRALSERSPRASERALKRSTCITCILLLILLHYRLLKAETTAVTKSERALKEAEKFTQKAAQMQADISQQRSTISKLEQEKAHALEDARSKHGQVQRLLTYADVC